MSGAGVSAINLLARSRSSQQQWHQYSTPGWPFTLPVFSQHHASQTHRGSQGGQHVRLRLKVTLIQQLLRCYWDERGRMECFVYPTLVTLTSYYSRLLPRQPSANNGYIPLKLAIKFTSAIIKQICKNYCFTFPGLRWKSRFFRSLTLDIVLMMSMLWNKFKLWRGWNLWEFYSIFRLLSVICLDSCEQRRMSEPHVPSDAFFSPLSSVGWWKVSAVGAGGGLERVGQNRYNYLD